MINLFGNVILNISSNPLLFLEILIAIIMTLIFAFPLWIYELHQVDKDWLAADTVDTNSESTVTLMRNKKCEPSEPIVQNVNCCATPYGESFIQSSVESLDLYSELGLDDSDEEMALQPLPDIKNDVMETKKGFLQESPLYVVAHHPRRAGLEGTIMYKMYDIIRRSFIIDYQPVTINLFQTNITEVDLHIGLDSGIPTSLMEIQRPDLNQNKENYISRQFRLFCKDHGDNSEEDVFRIKPQKKEPTKNNFNSVPFQLGAVTELLNQQIWSGQTITENAFSLVKILQSFANAERENKMKTPVTTTHKMTSFGNNQQTGYFASSFFTQMTRSNMGYMHKSDANRALPMIQEYNRTQHREGAVLNPPISTSYANLGFMCR